MPNVWGQDGLQHGSFCEVVHQYSHWLLERPQQAIPDERPQVARQIHFSRNHCWRSRNDGWHDSTLSQSEKDEARQWLVCIIDPCAGSALTCYRIETLLEDAYNERMHLLTFLKMAEPGWFMKFMILGAQGVFSNGFFLAYLVNPKICHRFVGYLEEEATNTYTLAIQDLEAGLLPEWDNLEAPEIAVNYWQMPEGHRTMRDLLYYIRADEAKHREIHHTLGNLEQATDPNPFVSEYKTEGPHPGKGIEHLRSTGWERKDVI
jgi:hypothetical protein